MGDIKRKATFEKLFREAVPNSEGKIWFQHPSAMYHQRKICFMMNGKEVKFLMYMNKHNIELWAAHFKELVETGEFDNHFYCRVTCNDPMVSKRIHKFPFTELGDNKFYAHHPDAMKMLSEARAGGGGFGLEIVPKPVQPRYTLVCSNCGSENVQSKAWVNANTNEYVGDCTDGSPEDFWCEDCKGHHNLTSKMK